MKVSYDNIQHLYAKNGYRFYDKGNFNVNIFAIRRQLNTNEFDDIIGIAYKNDFDFVEIFKATTDAGKYWLKNPMNRKGTAILVEGQYKYKLGLHKGKEALVQKAPVKVFRDNNKDENHDKGYIQEGFFGINIHRAGKDSKEINRHSAGCLVLSVESQFQRFIDIIKRSEKIYGNSFTVTLFEQL